MESAIAIFWILLLPAFVIMVPFETQRIGTITAASENPPKFSRRLWIASAAVACALIVGVTVGGIVMFGPSYIANDFVGLPWFTSIPAILLGCWSASRISKLVSRTMINQSK